MVAKLPSNNADKAITKVYLGYYNDFNLETIIPELDDYSKFYIKTNIYYRKYVKDDEVPILLEKFPGIQIEGYDKIYTKELGYVLKMI